jgi:2-iminobutanoate/2-iminopropanoate deaminase
VKRQSFNLNFRHAAPIPMACKVGPVLMTSGVPGGEPIRGDLPESVEEQAVLCFDNLKAVLEKAGMTMEDVIKITVLISEESARSAVNKPWLAHFPDEHSRPARHTLVVPLQRTMKIQLEAYAVDSNA